MTLNVTWWNIDCPYEDDVNCLKGIGDILTTESILINCLCSVNCFFFLPCSYIWVYCLVDYAMLKESIDENLKSYND